MPTTGERMARIESDMSYVKDGVEELRSSLKSHIEQHNELMRTLNDKFDSFDKKYAAKWVEGTLVGIGATVLGGLLLYLFTHMNTIVH